MEKCFQMKIDLLWCRRRVGVNCWYQWSALPLLKVWWHLKKRGQERHWRPTKTTPTKRSPTCSRGCKWWSSSRRIPFETGGPLWDTNIRLKSKGKKGKENDDNKSVEWKLWDFCWHNNSDIAVRVFLYPPSRRCSSNNRKKLLSQYSVCLMTQTDIGVGGSAEREKF